MIVVSDTSAISFLLRIGEIDLLRLTFSRVLIPTAVYDRLVLEANFRLGQSLIDETLFQAGEN